MNDAWLVVLQKTASLFLVMVAGWLMARRGMWSLETGRVLSRFLVDLVYPAYIIVQFLRTVDADTLRASWFIPLLGYAVVALGAGIGWSASGLIGAPVRRRTFVFIVALTNWVFLPLPIAEGLFGAEGVRAILLMNVGATAAMWTIGVGILNPGLTMRESVRHICANPGILATVAGLALAAAVPPLRNNAAGWPLLRPVMEAVDLLGLLMIPLALLVIGTQLGAQSRAALRPEPALAGALALSLIATPLAALLLVKGLAWAGWVIPEVPRRTFLLVAAMPPGFSITLFTDRYNGDSRLSAKSAFFGTFAGLATVPLFVRLLQAWGW